MSKAVRPLKRAVTRKRPSKAPTMGRFEEGEFALGGFVAANV